MNQPFKDHFKNQMKPQNAEFENRFFPGPSQQYLFEKIFPWILPRIIGGIKFQNFSKSNQSHRQIEWKSIRSRYTSFILVPFSLKL